VIRIFFTLAVVAFVCVAVALFLGIWVGELHKVIEPDVSADVRQATIERASVHRQAGLAAAIVVIFANSISVTYFIGTSRWCRGRRRSRNGIAKHGQLGNAAFSGGSIGDGVSWTFILRTGREHSRPLWRD
jgi:hypothetical protein